MLSPVGGTRGVGEDQTSGMSALQSIDDSSLGTRCPGCMKKLCSCLISAGVFVPAVGFGDMINLLRVQKDGNSLLFPMSTNHTRWWQEERSNVVPSH